MVSISLGRKKWGQLREYSDNRGLDNRGYTVSVIHSKKL